MPAWTWDENRRLAAQLIAEGELYDAEIAARVGVARQTIWVWRQSPEFLAGVDAEINATNAALRRRRISHVEQRIAALNDRWLRLQRVIAARSTDPKYVKGAGGGTGLLAHKIKAVGSGDNTLIVDEFEVDTGLLKELREIEKQAAIELGQWEEKQAITGLTQAHENLKRRRERQQPDGADRGVPGGPQPA